MEKQWIKTSMGKNGGYPLYTGQDFVTERIEEVISADSDVSGWVVITDENVARIYQRITDQIEAAAKNKALPFLLQQIPPGESSKTLGTVQALAEKMAKDGFDRNTRILALGGGVVGDIAGFLAAVYMRGIEYIQIPTTLLSQVDSSIGGKTGVNLPQGKNLLGSFYPPREVWVDSGFLKTLSRTDWINGYGELIKHGILNDEGLFDSIAAKHRRQAVLAADPDSLKEMLGLIRRGIQVKKEIVERDEGERGLRRLLNYGHTFGHALEAVTAYQGYRHGEAVCRGMVLEAEIARGLSLLSDKDFGRIVDLVEGVLSAGRDLPAGKWTIHQLLFYMARDKKNREGKISFILPEKIGKAREVLLKESEVAAMFSDRKL